ncbi:MAG TPA: FAD-dependent oxidoreductase [Solirubrobacteraceae bacterium]|nr:FAD-dependent oxidoreductase [Solirubrobacteraceae bacterium]
MAANLLSGSDPFRVVVAGGGVAALETIIGLRSVADRRLDLTLVAPAEHFIYRPLEVGEPFGLGHPRRYELAEVARDLGTVFRCDAVVRVRPGERTVALASGAELPYDALVVAVGARAVPAYEHGVTFDRELEAASFDEALGDVGAGLAPSVAVVVAPGVSWTLPAYELSLMTAAWGAAARAEGVRVTLVTAEDAALEAFGPEVSRAVEDILAAGGVSLKTGVAADVTTDTSLRLGRTGHWLTADRIVSLPALSGHRIAGLPHDPDGFLPVDDHGRVAGVERVYAAGDGTAQPIKQGGLAAQQADAVVEHLAAATGGEVGPRPYRGVLRGLLRTDDGPRYLRAELDDVATTSTISTRPLWWPPSKIASIWLSPYLAQRESARAATARPLATGGLARHAAAP